MAPVWLFRPVLSENSTFDFSRMVEAGGTESFYELDGLRLLG